MNDPISAYFAAVNAGDWDALAGRREPDAELCPAGGRPRRGREAIGAYYPRLLAGWAEHVDQPGRRITEANTVVVEIAFTGTTRQGRSVAFDAVDIFDLAGRGSGACRSGTTPRRCSARCRVPDPEQVAITLPAEDGLAAMREP